MACINDLPDELLIQIFEHLDDLSRKTDKYYTGGVVFAALSCQQFMRVGYSIYLAKHEVKRHGYQTMCLEAWKVYHIRSNAFPARMRDQEAAMIAEQRDQELRAWLQRMRSWTCHILELAWVALGWVE